MDFSNYGYGYGGNPMQQGELTDSKLLESFYVESRKILLKANEGYIAENNTMILATQATIHRYRPITM